MNTSTPTATPSSNFPAMREALFDYLDGRTCVLDGARGKLKIERGVWSPYYGSTSADRVYHEPAGARAHDCTLTDLTNSDRLWPIARRQGFDFAAWGY